MPLESLVGSPENEMSADVSDSDFVDHGSLVVVLTGASSGIGKATALQLAKYGTALVLASRRTGLLESVAEECGNAIAVTTDVSKPQDVEQLAQAAIAQFGKIDVWINNAGIGAAGRFEEVPLEDHLRVIETSLQGVIIGSHVALNQFKQQGYGTLINVGSAAGKVPMPYFASYITAKFGVVGLGEALYQELKTEKIKDIHVCTVNPWVTDTPWFEHAANYTGHVIRMPLPDDPLNVAKAIIELIDNPREEAHVGLTKAEILSHQLMPQLTESLTALMTSSRIGEGPVVSPSSGSLHQPMSNTSSITGQQRQPQPDE